MSSAPSPIPPDDPKRSLTVAQPDNLPHIGLVGDTYTITVTGEQTAGRFCVIDMHIPPGGGPPPHRHDFEETFIVLEGEIEATFRGQKSIVRAGNTIHSCQCAASVSQYLRRIRTHALYLLSGGTGKLLPGGWSASRHPYDASAEARRQRTGCVHR